MKKIILLILLISLVSCESNHEEHNEHNHDEHKHEEHQEHSDQDEEDKDGHDHSHEHSEEDGEGKDEDEDEDGHDHSHEHSDQKTGEGKAIVKVDVNYGIQLSKEAQKRLAIKTVLFETGFNNIPDNAYVVVGKERALYRKRNGFFKLVDEHELTGSFTKGDEVVISGIGLLRVSDIFSTDESDYGHAH
ncbi:putative lipoprotein [Bacteriovorax sp. BAL6_X]|uniref:hypothetical protein n=1 Tax=Bacteriovorax sp. BAL6_X TaxID=1201290 RepID=UPI000386EA02|nr:hypothetical protein [Bacteriovorax sp. BAL6_X]EPZ49878.1 putative lipoprotein [Bacteriovorax sp. BAL6_X]